VVAAAGGVLIVVSYLGVSAQTDPGLQLPYVVSGGFGGLGLVILGAALLIADRVDATYGEQREMGVQIDDLHQVIVAAAIDAAAAMRPGAPGAPGAPGDLDHPGWTPASPGAPEAAHDQGRYGDQTGYAGQTGPTAYADHTGPAGYAGSPGYSDQGLYAVPAGRTYHTATCEVIAGKPAQQVDPTQISMRGLAPCSICEPHAVRA
jgi:hypothetical protein